jgi:hypothetical protein
MPDDPTRPERVTFHAYLPDIASAINIDGNGDTAQIKFRIPRSDVDAVLLLFLYFTNGVFKVTVEDFQGSEKSVANSSENGPKF